MGAHNRVPVSRLAPALARPRLDDEFQTRARRRRMDAIHERNGAWAHPLTRATPHPPWTESAGVRMEGLQWVTLASANDWKPRLQRNATSAKGANGGLDLQGGFCWLPLGCCFLLLASSFLACPQPAPGLAAASRVFLVSQVPLEGVSPTDSAQWSTPLIVSLVPRRAGRSNSRSGPLL